MGAFRTHKGEGAKKWYTARNPTLDLSSVDIQPGQKFILMTTVKLTAHGNPIWKSTMIY